ncbi:MAG: RNA polymerase sigma-54 factor [Alphaproteobacteria bacterium]|nr:RNA polymerase factor sigma-54 [Alphaproteobacteria bacterium]TAD86602.1 MAG: RNA polymerase sigma-54 factor [Alphaproteobacteria bacterium]
MALAQRLEFRQSQALVMTPQLQQAIKLLQLSNMELSAFVEGELEQNPLLERDESGSPAAEPELPEASDGFDAPPAPTDSADLVGRDTLPSERDDPLDRDWAAEAEGLDEGAFGESAFTRGTSGSFDDEDGFSEDFAAGTKTLREHLVDQAMLDLVEPSERLIALTLIDLVDPAGYLVADLEEIAERFGCPRAAVEAVVARLQRLDPTGVCARDLKECLALQLAEKNRLDPAMQALLDNLHLLARRDVEALLRVTGVDQDDLAEMVAEIRALNPKPGDAFDSEPAQPVTPDILMRAQPGGGWLVELNADTLPRVLINTRFYARVNTGKLDKTHKEYLAERLASANWLVKSLHQRATTILKVATEIVRQQDAFFRHGIQYLRPLILRDIAEVIGMHESTVSRVTTNKYIATPRGIYELKYFFTSSIGSTTTGADAHSAEAVRHRIKTLIDAEPASDVLSDDKLVELLKAEGIDIARRTVAKYREAQKIPSSVQRRREKMLTL